MITMQQMREIVELWLTELAGEIVTRRYMRNRPKQINPPVTLTMRKQYANLVRKVRAGSPPPFCHVVKHLSSVRAEWSTQVDALDNARRTRDVGIAKSALAREMYQSEPLAVGSGMGSLAHFVRQKYGHTTVGWLFLHYLADVEYGGEKPEPLNKLSTVEMYANECIDRQEDFRSDDEYEGGFSHFYARDHENVMTTSNPSGTDSYQR